MVHEQSTPPLASQQNRYLLSGLLGLIGVFANGILQFLLLTGAALIFAFTYQVDDQTLAAHLFEWSQSTFSPTARKGFILCLGVAIPKFEKATTFVKTVHATRVREQQAEELVEKFLTLAGDDLQMVVPSLSPETKAALTDELVDSDGELTPETTFENIAEVVYAGHPQIEIEARLISILTLWVDRVDRATERHEVVTLIDRLVGGASFYPVDEQADAILTCYEACRLESWRETSDRSVFRYERTRADQALTRRFLREYSDEQRFKHILKNNRQIEELRSTLADLIRSGKLDIGNLHEDVIREKLDTVTRELREQEGRYSTYMVLSVQLINESDPYGAKAALETKFPTVKLGTWDVQHGSEFTEALLSTRLVYTSQEYASSDAFLNQEIKPLLPPESEYDDGAFVAVMPFEAPEYVSHPPKETLLERSKSDYWTARIEENFEYIESLQIGSIGLATEIVTDDLIGEISVDQLLRVIPFNVVAPQLKSEKKRIIRDNYFSLQRTFEVDSLFDWADVHPEDLATELQSIEPEIAYNEWEATSKTIIEGVCECHNATKVQPETLSV